MADPNTNPFSNNNSSDDSYPFMNAGGGSSSQLPPQPRKPRGRPPGSRNKPKAPIVITQENDLAMKAAIIEVAAGTDVIEAVAQFAERRGTGLSIMSGSGTVSTAQIHCPLAPNPHMTLHGPFTVLHLTGTYVASPRNPALIIGNVPPPPPQPPQLSLFGIMLTGVQGQIFGGVVGGRVVAGREGVTLMTTLYKNPELHRAGGVAPPPDEGGDDDDDDGDNAGGGGDLGAGPSGGGGSGSGSGAGGSCGGGYNGMNFQAPDAGFMQWTHPRPPPNY